jgi:bacterial/archaeal transporter family protein
MAAQWLLPALAYVILFGGLGVITKVALRHLGWPDLIVWTTAVYIVVSAVLLLSGRASLAGGSTAVGLAVVAGVMAVLSLVLLYVALGYGDASQVVPFTSTYPLVALVLAWVVLGEQVTAGRAVGAVLVVAGAVLLTR